MPFSNPIVGGTVLVRPAINSPDFVHNVAGWSINRDGSAEFSNAEIRGQVIVGTGNNAIELLKPPNIPSALTTFYGARSETITSVIVFNDSTGRYEYIANIGGGAMVMGAVSASGTVQETLFTWNQTPAASFAIGEASQVQFYISSQGSVSSQFLSDLPLLFSVSGTAETWHNVGFQNGWSNLGLPFVQTQYRLVPSPANSVQIVGSMVIGTKVDGTVIFNLPAGYRPAHEFVIPVTANASISTGRPPSIIVLPNGDVQCAGVNAAAITDFEVNVLIPLDA